MREDIEIKGGMQRARQDVGGGMSNYGRMPRYRNDGARSTYRFRLRRSHVTGGASTCAKCHGLDLV